MGARQRPTTKGGQRPARDRDTPGTVVPGRRPVREAIAAGRPLTEVVLADAGAPPDLAEAAARAGLHVRHAPREELDVLTGGVVHQGVVALGPAWAPAPLERVAGGDLLVLLDGITDPQNLGAIARTAEAVGAGGLVLPRRRSAAFSPAAHKAAAGALAWLPVAVVPNLVRALGELAGAGFWSAGLAQGGDDLYTSGLLDGKVALVVGAEGAGLSRLVRERCDGLIGIPQRGRTDSLNASVASAVALYEVLRRRTATGP